VRFLVFLLSLSAISLNAQEFSLGDARKVPEPKPDLPIYKYSPDGHCTLLRQGSSRMMFWPGEDSYRTTGTSVFDMKNCVKVLPMGSRGDYDNGGAWLYSVFQRGNGRLLGFYHAEDHRFPLSPASDVTAYKSIARCTSEDSGLTWGNREQILTSHQPKPLMAFWSGLGDHCTVWDEKNRRYLCFFQENGRLCMAMSADPEGRPGSWRKWYKGGFTEPGLGGRATPIPSLAHHSGGNPSVLWNTFLGRWVMVWHRWEGDIWISTSENLTDWSPPKLLLGQPSKAGKVWYPTLIGESDEVGGQSVSLLYAEFPDKNSPLRRFLTREIVFRENTHKRNSTKGDGSCAASR